MTIIFKKDRRALNPWLNGKEGPKEKLASGAYDQAKLYGRTKKKVGLFRPQPPGPIKHINPLTGEEETQMPKNLKNKPVEEEIEKDEELEDEAEEEEDEEEDEDEEKPSKGRGNPQNLTPREPVKVPAKIISGVSEEVQKLLKKREKLLAAGDQKGLRKVRASLRKAGFRLSDYAGKDDKIAQAAKAKAAEAKPSKKVAKDEEDED